MSLAHMIDELVDEIYHKGWGRIPHFLSGEELHQFSGFFEGHRSEFNPATVGKEKKRKEEIRGDYTYWLDPFEHDPLFSRIMLFLEELKKKVNQRLFLGLKEFEGHLAIYPVGAFYRKHSDRFEKDSSRALSFIFYLHEKWEAQDGGELVLYNDKGEEVEKIFPDPGTFICFLSDRWPHEVRVSSRERRSLTGWMHTKIIN